MGDSISTIGIKIPWGFLFTGLQKVIKILLWKLHTQVRVTVSCHLLSDSICGDSHHWIYLYVQHQGWGEAGNGVCGMNVQMHEFFPHYLPTYLMIWVLIYFFFWLTSTFTWFKTKKTQEGMQWHPPIPPLPTAVFHLPSSSPPAVTWWLIGFLPLLPSI